MILFTCHSFFFNLDQCFPAHFSTPCCWTRIMLQNMNYDKLIKQVYICFFPCCGIREVSFCFINLLHLNQPVAGNQAIWLIPQTIHLIANLIHEKDLCIHVLQMCLSKILWQERGGRRKRSLCCNKPLKLTSLVNSLSLLLNEQKQASQHLVWSF